jgi:hypothetical protein
MSISNFWMRASFAPRVGAKKARHLSRFSDCTFWGRVGSDGQSGNSAFAGRTLPSDRVDVAHATTSHSMTILKIIGAQVAKRLLSG